MAGELWPARGDRAAHDQRRLAGLPPDDQVGFGADDLDERGSAIGATSSSPWVSRSSTSTAIKLGPREGLIP